jgi:hypothetical protein
VCTCSTAISNKCSCPLDLQAGLTNSQALLYFEAAAQHYLAITTIFMSTVPVVYLFTQVSPLVSSLRKRLCWRACFWR